MKARSESATASGAGQCQIWLRVLLCGLVLGSTSFAYAARPAVPQPGATRPGPAPIPLSVPRSPQLPVTAPVKAEFYRTLTLRIRDQGEFKVPMPAHGDLEFQYALAFADPAYDQPIISDTQSVTDPKKFFRQFWDRIYLKDSSYLELNGERLPLTCVFVSGQDNRYSGKAGPQIPQLIMNIFLVANDYTCAGPLRPGWPTSGGRREAWDTYLHFHVQDPTIMLPMDTKLRYRWNEFDAVLVDRGGQP